MKNQHPVNLDGVTYYPLYDVNYFRPPMPVNGCTGCVEAKIGGNPARSLLCDRLNTACNTPGTNHGCRDVIWQTGDEAVVRWTVERFDE